MLRVTLVNSDVSSNSQRIVLIIPSEIPGKSQLNISRIDKFDQLRHLDELNEQSRNLTRIEADRILALLDGLTTPTVPMVQKGIEKETHMLKFEREANSVTYFWCKFPPKGWEKIGELSSLMVGMAEL